jgi:CDP-diacylglycerol--glycerol-3-phosphate 3-phosphatidyltransferase
MTISNILTVSRIILAPVFVVLMVVNGQTAILGEGVIIILWALYLVMEFTDLADGFFARLLKQESELGRVLDPFADSLSRTTCFFGFTLIGIMPWWIFILVFYRDMWVSFLRINLAKRGTIQGARLSGKIKAWVYALANILALASFTAGRVLPFRSFSGTINIFCLIGFYSVAVIALWSGIDYSIALSNRKNTKKNIK